MCLIVFLIIIDAYICNQYIYIFIDFTFVLCTHINTERETTKMHQWLISVYVRDRVPDERDLPFWDQLVSRLETLASQREVINTVIFFSVFKLWKNRKCHDEIPHSGVFLKGFPCHFEVQRIENPTLWWHFVSYRLSPGFPDIKEMDPWSWQNEDLNHWISTA